jgi:hypothetical protein
MHLTSDYIHPYRTERVSRCLSAGEQGDTDGSETTRRCSWRRGHGNFRKNPNRFPSHSMVLKLLLQMYGVRHRNGHKTQPDARRRDEVAGEEDTMRDTGTAVQTPSTRAIRIRVPTIALWAIQTLHQLHGPVRGGRPGGAVSEESRALGAPSTFGDRIHRSVGAPRSARSGVIRRPPRSQAVLGSSTKGA